MYANTHQDDIIITSDSFEEHLSHIRDVLGRLTVWERLTERLTVVTLDGESVKNAVCKRGN